MNRRLLRRLLWLVAALLPFVAWFSMRYDPYAIDGDAVAYMDIADLMHAHQWGGVVNAYWHPLYPALLLLGQLLFHPTRMTELGAYYRVNYFIFLLEAVAVVVFGGAICRLRDRMSAIAAATHPPDTTPPYLLPVDAVRLFGLALLVIASQRELTLGKVRPDGLLQAMLLFGFAAMLQLATSAASSRSTPAREMAETGSGVHDGPASSLPATLGYAALMGLSFGLAYLTKSFALLVALLSFAAVALFLWRWLRQKVVAALLPSAIAFAVFAVFAGPYVAALSHQKHRLDFGDSGSLNYAWYVGGTEKFHLEPWQTERFGSSDVHLLHPERQLLADPGVYSYKALPYGTIPPWFDATFFNERIVTHLRVGQLLHRDVRNAELIVRYLLNHPEAWLLLTLLLALGARVGPGWRHAFWLLPVALGTAIWAIYSIVNVEERYVTAGYLTLLMPLFAALRAHTTEQRRHTNPPAEQLPEAAHLPALPGIATTAVCLLALLSLGESVRIDAENRREFSLAGLVPAWRNPAIFGAAAALRKLGLGHGEEIACIGSTACVNDPYWMRAAGVRTTTEVFLDDTHIAEDLQRMPNRDAVYRLVQAEGARVLVGHFDDPSHFTGPAADGWLRLGTTGYFALPLNLPTRSASENDPRP